VNHLALQILMRRMGTYAGNLDGDFGPASRAAVINLLTSKQPADYTVQDLEEAAANLGCEARTLKAVIRVESGGRGFSSEGLPVILAEPHVFSRLTQHRYDAGYPALSYPTWDRSKYPKTQQARWDQFSRMVGLDVDAGFAAASYGLFQILGCNYAACGFNDSFEHALAHSVDEECQLAAFQNFVRANGMVPALQKRDWATFARKYNGPGYAANKYDQRLAAAYAAAV